MGLGLETWVSPHTGVGEGEGEMGNEIGRKGEAGTPDRVPGSVEGGGPRRAWA